MASGDRFRIHAIILTRDRPDTLARCVSSVLCTLGGSDVLTVIDDSGPNARIANSRALLSASNPANILLNQLVWESTCAALGKMPTCQDATWLERTFERDIAPLRNLSLLLAATVSSETVVLIDDDIIGMNLLSMHAEVAALRSTGSGAIVGAEIGGLSELDVVTRLWNAIDFLAERRSDAVSRGPREVFRATTGAIRQTDCSGHYASGGCLAFSLTPQQMTAFPPGYNEDWLWCLLGQRQDVRTAWSASPVTHDPPWVRRPSADDCLFELVGDLVLDCLEELRCENVLTPAQRLERLSKMKPGNDLFPETRVRELCDRLAAAAIDAEGRTMLREHGLASLIQLRDSGKLSGDWGSIVAAWSRDATSKLRSHQTAMLDVGVLAHLRSIWKEGRP
ncbi:MAG: hypothetical protein ACREJD_08330 [Phycisphaerales bacterium]